MSALAAIVLNAGNIVHGSDRSRDQGALPDKFSAFERAGMILHPQDGSGVTPDIDALVVSSAVEASIPDVKKAHDLGLPIIKRAELLAELFNAAPQSVSIAGTSGKSTITGMLATILDHVGWAPTVMNGGMMRNFSEAEGALANMRSGAGKVFVAETDESDGSIALYSPSVAVLSNIALDHKGMEELNTLFGNYLAKANQAIVVNRDDVRVMALVKDKAASVLDFSLQEKGAKLYAHSLEPQAFGIRFVLGFENQEYRVHLKVPGRHNVANALAALGAAHALGIDMDLSCAALEAFKGIGRRMELIGTTNDITVLDDFGHNPDKISASLQTLKAFNGRLLVMFQPHGFGPLKMMGREIAEAFTAYLGPEDVLYMPEAYYAGGTVDRSVTAQDVIKWVQEKGVRAHWFAHRTEILPELLKEAKSGDRIVVMGARDDTLTEFAQFILSGIPG